MVTEPIISRMSLNGHPIHPMLIHFPVALLLSLVATDVAYLFTEDVFWARASIWLAGIGALGGWVSGMAGLVDLVAVRRIRQLITAWCHSILAVMLLSIATFNWLVRLGDPAGAIFPLGLYLSLLGAMLIAITSYLGGRLVYDYAVGVNLDEAAAKQQKFHKAATDVSGALEAEAPLTPKTDE